MNYLGEINKNVAGAETNGRNKWSIGIMVWGFVEMSCVGRISDVCFRYSCVAFRYLVVKFECKLATVALAISKVTNKTQI